MDKLPCTLLLFLATPAKEEAFAQAATDGGLTWEKIKDSTLVKYHWSGTVGTETVIAIRPIRDGGRLVIGSVGVSGLRPEESGSREATRAQAIVQLGMAFALIPTHENHATSGSSSLIPYDNREVEPNPDDRGRYVGRLLASQPTAGPASSGRTVFS